MLFFLTTLSQGQYSINTIQKINEDSIAWFDNTFDHVIWTGEGLSKEMEIDQLQTNEVRARLQTVFGSPTKTIEDLIGRADFNAAQAIQFEYWFVVNDTIPLVALDIEGPFRTGLVLGGFENHKQVLPGIKKELSELLMAPQESFLQSYNDFYYSIEREKWFKVSYQRGQFKTTEISAPSGLEI
jgi:hypothetical protein